MVTGRGIIFICSAEGIYAHHINFKNTTGHAKSSTHPVSEITNPMFPWMELLAQMG